MTNNIRALVLIACCAVQAGAATPASQTQDVLGAHQVYGRGCVACHTPHSGATANGGHDGRTGNWALWGQDLTPYLGKTFQFGGNSASPYTVTFPASYTSQLDPTTSIMLCLSCHDGTLAKNAFMRGKAIETVTINGQTFDPPTLLGSDGGRFNSHPVGPSAIVGCGGGHWDCTDNGDGTISMIGPNSSQFVKNYGFTIKTFNNGAGKAMVTCQSCHDQHSMTAYSGTIGGVQGTYKTMFFVRGYYDPSNPAGNSAAQFCRQCHAEQSNEAKGAAGAGVPTI